MKIDKPTITDLTFATHNHEDAVGGAQLDHTAALTNVGSNTHAQIDTHIADSTLHFTEGSIDHGNLDATSLTHDDHSQYMLLAGRAGGQTLIGGTGVGDDLTLQTTSNVSKGTYFLSDLTSNGFVKTSGGTGLLSVSASIDLTTDITGILPLENGGTELDTSGVTNGQLLIGNTTGNVFALATLTGTANEIDISNGASSITIGIPSSPTFAGQPTISDFTSANHNHRDASGGGQLDHGLALTGLTGGDDHTQYAFLAGRSGGQTLNGGALGGEDLTLSSNVSGSKGTIFLGVDTEYDEVNKRLGLNMTPTLPLDINADSASSANIRMSYNRTNSANKWQYLVTGHYTTSEQDVIALRTYNYASGNAVYVGGGDASYNAATLVALVTGATATTTSGTIRLSASSTGLVRVSDSTVHASTHSLGANSLLIEDELEVDGTAWFDGGANMDGSTLSGDDASGGDLTLQSTSHATKGSIIFGTASAYSEVDDRFGVGELTPSFPVDIVSTDIPQIRLSSVTTDATNKAGYLGIRHYTNASDEVCIFGSSSTSTANNILFGGGTGNMNAATNIGFYTASTTTTTTGTLAMTIFSDSYVRVGGSGTPGTISSPGQGDLHVTDEMEVDGTAYMDGEVVHATHRRFDGFQLSPMWFGGWYADPQAGTMLGTGGMAAPTVTASGTGVGRTSNLHYTRLNTTNVSGNVASIAETTLAYFLGNTIDLCFTADLVTWSSIADIRIWCGLAYNDPSGYDTPSVANDDIAGFRFSTNVPDTNWIAVTSNGGSTTTTDTGVAVSTSSYYRLTMLYIDSDTEVKFYINNSLVATHTTNLPNNFFRPWISLTTLSTNYRYFGLNRLVIQSERSA